MKRALFAAAAGALGALGTAGLMAASPASAAPDPCEATPALTPARVACVAAQQTNTFIGSANPVTQIDTFINGTPTDTDFGSLGVAHQGSTFVNSITGPGGFLDGPRSPDPDE